jgi:hypothetical protein
MRFDRRICRLNGADPVAIHGQSRRQRLYLAPIFQYSAESPFDITEGITNWDGLGVNRPSIIGMRSYGRSADINAMVQPGMLYASAYRRWVIPDGMS